jgi:hypothetical protein
MRIICIAVTLLSLSIVITNATCTAYVDGTTYELSALSADQTINYPIQGKTVSLQ